MPNEKVFIQADAPIFTNVANTYQDPTIVALPENGASRSGSLFSLNTSASGTVVLSLISVNASIRLNNTAGSGRTLYFSRLVCGVGGSSLLSNVTGAVTVT
jgi:hypothetical protein